MQFTLSITISTITCELIKIFIWGLTYSSVITCSQVLNTPFSSFIGYNVKQFWNGLKIRIQAVKHSNKHIKFFNGNNWEVLCKTRQLFNITIA